ncbi:hypothetical protein UFOVP1004_34 [uncultured Caudovirales phage]|uniref:Uncharacterized protein n=1 Tax=uncultured Caudovirales phage TaxID=2100421 RepID=A0A6J5Q8S5_9CAUD|nr:hypothetical protein UFOVP1004_34 [uncultured Caudovirales phage]
MSSHQIKFIRRAASAISIGRSNSRAVDGSGGSYTIGWASGGAATVGTLLVAVVEEATSSGTHPYITGGSAWTRLGTTKCYYKICGAAEPATYTISYAGSSKGEGSAVAILEVFGATSVESTLDASATNVSPSVTSTNANNLVVVAAGNNSALGTVTPPTGWTKQSTGSGNAVACIGTKLVAGSGTISPGNWNTTYTKLYTLAIKP